METCITSIKGKNSFFIQSSMARADLNLCRVLSSVFFSLAAAELLTTLRQAARKILFVARTTVLRGLVTHSRYSLSYSNTFTTAISVCMCFSNAYDHFPPALSPEKSRDSSTTLAKRRPTLGSLSANAWLLTETAQLFSGTVSQWLVKQSSFRSLAMRSPSLFWKAACRAWIRVLAVRMGLQVSCYSSILLQKIGLAS